MSEQNTEFEKWKWSAKLKVKQPLIYETNLIKEAFNGGYRAATAEANKRIAELQANNDDLREAIIKIEYEYDYTLDVKMTNAVSDAMDLIKATPAESLQADNKHYRDAILKVKRQIESNRVWSGMKYTYTPMPEFKQIRCIEAIDEALKEVK